VYILVSILGLIEELRKQTQYKKYQSTMKNLLNVAIVLSGVIILPAQAQTILAQYTFDNSNNVVDFASTDIDASTDASLFGSGAGFNLNTDVVTTGFTSEGLGLSDGTGDGPGSAITANDFFTFSIDGVAGETFSLGSISLDVGRGVNGAQDFFLFSSVGGFNAGDQIDTALDITTDGSSIDFTFTDSAFTNLTDIEFRIYVDDRFSNTGGGSATFVDNIVVTSAIPEPSASMLLGLGGLALLSRRKRA